VDRSRFAARAKLVKHSARARHCFGTASFVFCLGSSFWVILDRNDAKRCIFLDGQPVRVLWQHGEYVSCVGLLIDADRRLPLSTGEQAAKV
jgi:hypothetical protein